MTRVPCKSSEVLQPLLALARCTGRVGHPAAWCSTKGPELFVGAAPRTVATYHRGEIMMWQKLRPLAWTGMAAAALAASGVAWADRGGHSHGHRGARVGIGVYLGPGIGYPVYRPAYPYYQPYPYGWSPPVMAVPAEPPVYIERGNDAPAYSGGTNGQLPQGYWYRCNEPDGYYPYITQCPGGWLQVPAQPPAN
jgi:hypothetical protein